MSTDYGWAYLKTGLLTSSAGVAGSIQFKDSTNISGSDKFFYQPEGSTLFLTGNFNILGTLSASTITTTNNNIVNLSFTGSTDFGTDCSNNHKFTGSVFISCSSTPLNINGLVAGSAASDSHFLVLDSNNNIVLSSSVAGATPAIDNYLSASDNRIITSVNADTVRGEENLTFDGTSLVVTGHVTASVGISSSVFTDGSAVITNGNISGVGTITTTNVSASNVGGTLTTAAQPNITSVGALTSLVVNGNLQVDSNVLRVNATTNRVAINKNTPSRALEIYDNTDAQLRLLGFAGDGLSTADEYADLQATSDGYLILSSSGGRITTTSNVGIGVSAPLGALHISASSDTLVLEGLKQGTTANNQFLALSGSTVILTSSAGGGGGSGGSIGAAEDGSYTDGLYTDFTTATPVGTAVDRFNEILKLIVPGGAPAVDRINYTINSGIGLKLSFDSTATATGYTNVSSTGSFSSASLNEQYIGATSGEDFKLGVYDGTQPVTGVINFNTVKELKGSYVNYADKSFGNADSGSLRLIVNGSQIHSLNLNTFTGTGSPNTGSASDLNSSGSGFIKVSTTASARDQNNVEYDIFQHRSAEFVVNTSDQQKGWNYAKVEHVYGNTTYVTNFIQWVNDTDAGSNSMLVANETLTPTMQGSKYLSGVQYFRSASVVYNADVSNVYKFTYPTGNVLSFNQSNLLAASAQSLPSIGVSENNTKVLRITASSNNSSNTMFGTSFERSINLTHPFKTNLSTAGTAAASGALIYNVDTANTNILENYSLEDFRITSGSYNVQANVTSSNATWNSKHHMTGGGAAGHTDGLMFYNGQLVSPINTSHAGITNGNFSSLVNGPSGNPDYSSTSDTRTFYRKIQNTSGGQIRDLKITSTKTTRINNSALTTNNVNFYVKIPGTSGWMDISQNFAYGSIADGDGALINGATDNSNTGTTSTSNSVHCVTFGTASVANNDYVVVRVEASASWTNYISQLQFQLGASDVSAPSQAPALDDIDANNTGDAAKLSFGSSNNLGEYSSVTGSSISLTNFDSNANYTVSGDRRGIFSSFPTIAGELNEDVSVSGNNYSANSFFNAYSGSIVLEVNGVEVHTLSLVGTRNSITDNFNGNSSGFSVGPVNFSTTSDNIPDYTKPYRTGSYQIGANDQKKGWNYARVIHRTNADQVTNYVEWVVDPSGSVNDTAVSAPTLSNFGHSSKYYQSGIGYFASRPTGSFTYTGSNFYRNVYYNGSDGIAFGTTTNCSISNIRVSGAGVSTFDSAVSQASFPNLNNTTDCETRDIQVTGTVLFDSLTSISGGLSLFTDYDVSVASTLKHVFKTDRTTSTASKTAFLVYSGSGTNSTQQDNEYFDTEVFRLVSGSYNVQANLTSSTNIWNSSTAMNNGGTHDDGAVMVNGYLISPKQIGHKGDTRSLEEGGSLQSPNGNPNYSSLTNSTRTFYRYFFNDTVNDRSSVTVTLYGSGSLVKKATSLGANGNFYVEVKIPGKTAWLDLGTAFSSNNPLVDGAGALDGAAPGNPAVTISGGGTSIVCNFNGESLLGGASDEKFAMKISANENWVGYLSRVRIQYS